MFPALPCFEGPPINLTGGIFTTTTGLSASVFSFLNITTGWWYAPSFTSSGRASKESSVGALSTSLFLHDYVALLYHESMSYSHIILSSWYHITNWYCNSSACHLCTTWGTLASDSNIFCSPLKSDSTVNYDPHKYFLDFSMAHLTTAASLTKLFLDFSSGDTVDIEMKDIGCRHIPSREFSNSQCT